tara:strand:- start:1279 stop:1530 length:252 start_codon:yes stop_codon:yes gene_type:complete
LKKKENKTSRFNWKNLLDQFLVWNLFLIIIGFFFFLFSFIASANGNSEPYKIFQLLWFPLFIPALSTFFTAVLIEWIVGKIRN